MNQYQAKNIINLAVAGHGGAGKTSLAEAMLYLAGVSDRRGKVGEGNTVCDYDPEEIRRKASISAASAPLEWKNKKINLLDAPGLFDFEGGMCEAMRAADTALIVVSGRDGVAVGTEKAFAAAEKNGLAKIFFVNGLCDESARFYRVFEDLKANFGPSVCPVVVPFIQDGQANIYINLLEYKAYDYSGGKPVAVAMPDMGDRLEGLRTAIYEAVAETDDELFEKYFAGEPFTPEEVIVGVSKGVKSGTITPVFCGDALLMRGMEQFMDGLCWLAPSAEEKAGEIGLDVDGSPVELSVNEDGAVAAIVFKTVADPFIGKLSYVKVVSGKISTDSQLVNMRTGNTERVGKTVMLVGKKQVDVKYIGAGDIGAIPKLTATNTGDTLCSPTRKVTLDGVEYPNPTLRMAIVPAKKGEEDKVAQGMMRLSEEDPTLQFSNQQRNPRDDFKRPGRAAPGRGCLQAEEQVRRGCHLEETQGPLPRDHPQEPCRSRAGTRSRPAATASSATFGSSSPPATAKAWNSASGLWAALCPRASSPRWKRACGSASSGAPWRATLWWACPPCCTTALTTRWIPQKWPLRRRRPWPIRRACPRPTLCCWSPSAT